MIQGEIVNEHFDIPNKSVFKLNEVCTITGVKPYVIRFWESEFEEISPITSSSGQKLYEHKDINAISQVKKLLFEEKMSVEQAKFQLQKVLQEAEETQEPQESIDSLDSIDSNEEQVIFEQEVSEVASPSLQEQIDNKMASTGRFLSDLEVQKLVLAKAKLNSIISLIDAF